MQTREEADAVLRAAVKEVTRHGHPQLRGDALAALRREVERESARVRQESRSWALKVAGESLEHLRAAVASGGHAVKDALEGLARDLSDVSDERFEAFTAGPFDVATVQGAIRSRAGAPWLAAFLALRTGALGMDVVTAPSRAQVLAARDALRKTPRS